MFIIKSHTNRSGYREEISKHNTNDSKVCGKLSPAASENVTLCIDHQVDRTQDPHGYVCEVIPRFSQLRWRDPVPSPRPEFQTE